MNKQYNYSNYKLLFIFIFLHKIYFRRTILDINKYIYYIYVIIFVCFNSYLIIHLILLKFLITSFLK